MARTIWRGVISFGLVTVPVGLYPAVRPNKLRFRQLHGKTHHPIRQERVDAETGERVEHDALVKGYEVGDGRYIVVDPEELDELAPEASRTIDILDFVDLAEIDPVLYDRPYHLAPDGKPAAKPYRLLADSMESADRVAVARFVMRGNEHLATVRARRQRLILSTMHFADELVDLAEVTDPSELEAVEVSDRERSMAEQVIDSMTVEFEPERYTDQHRERVLAFLDAKAEGSEVRIEEGDRGGGQVIDLEEALERSLRRGAGGGPGGGGGDGGGGAGGDDAGADAGPDASDGGAAGGGAEGGADTEYGVMSRDELYELAQQRDIEGRSGMSKEELVEALRASDVGAA